MAQLPLELTPPLAPTLDNFLPGANVAAVAALRAPQGLHYLHGPAGVGKTHLLRALGATTAAAWVRPGQVDAVDEAYQIVLIDDVQALDAEQQHAAFVAYVQAATLALPVVAAGQWAPVDLHGLRADLQSRLAWGQVHALAPLGEDDLRRALNSEARRRGLLLPADVLDYVLARAPRTWPWLRAWLLALDARALAEQRTATIPLAREVMLALRGHPDAVS